MSRSKRSGKRSGTAACLTDHVDEPSNCIICLERVSCRGKLSVCNHWFCFPCILEWAEVKTILLNLSSILLFSVNTYLISNSWISEFIH